MSRYRSPRHSNLKLRVEITPKVCTYSLISIDLNLPILSKITKVLIIIEKQIKLDFIHNFRSLNSQQNLIRIQPLRSTMNILISQVQSLRIWSILSLTKNNRNDNVNHLLSRLVQSISLMYIHIGVMNNRLMHLHKKRISTCYPVIVLFAYCNIHYLLSAVSLLFAFFEWDEFEDQRDRFSRVQEECVVLADHIVSFWFTVCTILSQKYCSATK